ncbi:uncharacterized protein MELLADRAFT_111876 [Melampsora larici-populina 98AG31]|uniref:CxC1-like cysteine cluster associated with KDZ transposases domain-containing protein n=1 Tax=Melampsora larici-populina (strain 98AG31 / pathotype 3-4-7) TaxID=747676 RepID=F4S4N3_MELLP|nr:uncharacterized protein MELLADRAFT_111876 [Melampsora larici-populina 98AG31]EGG00317.1 hypothetical protein MELLADRAFT_111876 [Melampsora larici-populina 98AG31]
MPLPGSLIPNPNKRQRHVNEPRRPAPGSVAERLAQLQQREAEASQGRIARLDDTRIQNNPPHQHHYNNDDGSDNEQPQALYDHFQMNAENDDIAPVNDGLEIHPPGVRSAYFKSVSFQERTLTEELHWKEVIPDLFNAFMVCSLKTRQWGDENKWDHDFNSLCECPHWKRSVVEVDVVDLTTLMVLQIKFYIIIQMMSMVATSPLGFCTKAETRGLRKPRGLFTPIHEVPACQDVRSPHTNT